MAIEIRKISTYSTTCRDPPRWRINVFVCNKCKEPFYVLGSELRGNTLRVYCQCLNGHKGKRDVSRYQADGMAPDIFKGLFTCVACGSTMSLLHSDLGRKDVEYTFLCPIHGPQSKRIPSFYHSAVTGAADTVNSAKSVLDSLSCPKCGQIFSAHDVVEKKGILEFRFRCPNGHKELRFVSSAADPSILKPVFKRLIHCEQCGLPCTVLETKTKGEKAQIEMSCPAHGKTKKELPAKHAWMIEKISEAISEGTIVKSMLKCTQCSNELSIKSIELDKNKYKLKCGCSNGHMREMSQPTDLDEEALEAITDGILKCNECDLLSEMVGNKIEGSRVDIDLVCYIHGAFRKSLTGDLFKQLEQRNKQIDRTSDVEESLKCTKCSSPVTIKDTKVKDNIVELKVECRNGHSDERYLSTKATHETLSRIYMQLFECYKCHSDRDLVRIDDENGKTEVLLHCLQHQDSKVEIPEEHTEVVRDAYLQTKTLPDLERLMEKALQTKRACEYQMDKNADPTETLDIVKNIIEQNNVLFVDEKTDSKAGLEAWYYGKALDGDEFVVVGSVSQENLSIRITIASNNESKLELMLSEMRDNLREVLLRIETESGDTAPKIITCPQCGAALTKKALPGETIKCEHCGTPLHFG